MAFSESTPIAFDADATTELAFCAEAPLDSRITTSAAPVSVLSIRVSSRTRLRQAQGWPCVRLLYLRRVPSVYRKGAAGKKKGRVRRIGPARRLPLLA